MKSINKRIKKINKGLFIDTTKYCPFEKKVCLKEACIFFTYQKDIELINPDLFGEGRRLEELKNDSNWSIDREFIIKKLNTLNERRILFTKNSSNPNIGRCLIGLKK
jgi:hypothetical protein